MRDIKNNSIIIVPSVIKNKVIKEITSKGINNIKIMTMDEVKIKYYFDYDVKAIYYLMKKYNYKYDVAKMYLKKLYEVGTDDFGNSKIKKIIDIKDELDNEGLLYYNNLFKEYISSKTLIFYNCNIVSKEDKKLVMELENITKVEVIEEDTNNYNHEFIYEFETVEDEVHYVASRICDLVRDGIDINNIKLCGVNSSYTDNIIRIFKWYNIPVIYNDNYLYSTKIGQEFLKNLSTSKEISLKYIEDNYSLDNLTILEIYNQIIKILNKYTFVDSLLDVKEILIEDFKCEKVNKVSLLKEVSIINNLREANDDDIVFLMGFNQGDIPRTYKDEDYFNDDLRILLDLDITNSRNINEYNGWLKDIKNTKNLIITTKKTSPLGVHYISSLNDELNLEIKKEKITYNYSNLYNRLSLASKIDTFVKYSEKKDDLELLYSNYQDIPYLTFNNNYKKIDIDKLKDYMDNKLTLSYSAMNTYYQCGFRYYLANILKLNIYEETFYTVVGNLFHYILSIVFEKDIDIKYEYYKYIDECNYEFNLREKFFLKKLEKELEFIVDVIVEQNEFNSLNKAYYEEKIVVDKSREDISILFKGFVDKMLTNEDNSIISIIDYKTGNPNINLNNSIYGLDLQLPVYVYLARKKFPGIKIAGFYLQKILNSEITKDYKNTYEDLKIDKLKLQGYSNCDTSILDKFDSSYNKSKVIKGMRTSSKGISSSKILDDVKIDKLEEITENKIDEAIDSILDANFSINPKRVGMDNLGCKYCSFKDICFYTEVNIENLKEYKKMEFLGGEEDDTN